MNRVYNFIITDEEIIFEFKKQDFINMFEGLYDDFDKIIKSMYKIVKRYKKPSRIEIK